MNLHLKPKSKLQKSVHRNLPRPLTSSVKMSPSLLGGCFRIQQNLSGFRKSSPCFKRCVWSLHPMSYCISCCFSLPWHLTIIHVDEACAVCHLATDQIHQGVACHNDHGEGHASHETRLLAPQQQGSEGPSSLGGKTSYTSALCRIV